MLNVDLKFAKKASKKCLNNRYQGHILKIKKGFNGFKEYFIVVDKGYLFYYKNK